MIKFSITIYHMLHIIMDLLTQLLCLMVINLTIRRKQQNKNAEQVLPHPQQ